MPSHQPAPPVWLDLHQGLPPLPLQSLAGCDLACTHRLPFCYRLFPPTSTLYHPLHIGIDQIFGTAYGSRLMADALFTTVPALHFACTHRPFRFLHFLLFRCPPTTARRKRSCLDSFVCFQPSDWSCWRIPPATSDVMDKITIGGQGLRLIYTASHKPTRKGLHHLCRVQES